jgi:hypothetical protein
MTNCALIAEIREMLARPPGAFYGSDQLRQAMRALQKLETPAVRQDNHKQQANRQENGDLNH